MNERVHLFFHQSDIPPEMLKALNEAMARVHVFETTVWDAKKYRRLVQLCGDAPMRVAWFYVGYALGTVYVLSCTVPDFVALQLAGVRGHSVCPETAYWSGWEHQLRLVESRK